MYINIPLLSSLLFLHTCSLPPLLCEPSYSGSGRGLRVLLSYVFAEGHQKAHFESSNQPRCDQVKTGNKRYHDRNFRMACLFEHNKELSVCN